ncbi:MAG TPA: protein-glutamate O-methyltransferase CheR, partial [Candidatus Angelobacter sp.]|nr:protein-glutamate O-methyltransferase CheR [Candidatus Angelobacter sp.]
MAEKDQSANMATAGPELSPLLALIEERSGISFGDSPEHDFTARVREHMTAKKLAHASALLRLVRDSNLEYDELLECLLAHPTWFLRSSSTFAVLEKKVLSEMHQRKFWENPRNLRIWSAGCATGEEPYSIAMTICDSLEFASAWNIHILATDISRASLQQAERGLYPLHSLGALTARQKETYFTLVNEQYLVRPTIRNMVSFAQMNLSQPVYMGRFDIIFCMNVLFYFNEARRAALVQRFHEYLESGGYLFVGSAEAVSRAAAGKFEVSTHG